MGRRERDRRLNCLNPLLHTPHRNLVQLWPVHGDLVAKDPRFYVRLAAWYADHGEVRDHKEMFVIALVLSEFDGHRDVGLAMLREMPPYQVARVVDFINGRKEKVRLKVEDPGQPAVKVPKKMQRKKKLPVEVPADEGAAVTGDGGLSRQQPG